MEIVIATSNTDNEGDKFMPGSIKMREGKPCFIFHNFDYKSKPIGAVKSIYETDGVFFADIEFYQPEGYNHLFPAVGIDVIKYTKNKRIRKISEVKLWCVGLCESPNVDPFIKTIGEQIKTTK